MKLIKESELAQLLRDRAMLNALRSGGVDNWCGFDYSLEEDEDMNREYSYRGMYAKDDEELVKDYQDYEVNRTEI